MASRLLTVNLEPKYYQGNIPVWSINYRSSSINLTEEEYNQIVSEIPSNWNTENDKLIRFIYFDDNTYFCEREKKVFNYTIRETEPKIYRFDYATQEEANALYAFFVEKYAKIKISRTENLYDSVINEIKDLSLVKLSLLDARQRLLQDTDYLMMADYPLPPEERAVWEKYRQDLRDLTNQQAWLENDLMKIEMPVSPRPFDQLGILKSTINDLSSIPDNLTEEIIDDISENTIEDIIKNITQTSIKFEILKSISKMKLPILNIDYDSIVADKLNYETFLKEVEFDDIKDSVLPENWWEAATSNIEAKIEQVNKMLQSYDVSFTINDILNSIVEQNKLDDQEVEVNTIIEEL